MANNRSFMPAAQVAGICDQKACTGAQVWFINAGSHSDRRLRAQIPYSGCEFEWEGPRMIARKLMLAAALVMTGCAGQELDPAQVETTLSNAQRAARANCAPAIAAAIDVDADAARLALHSGMSSVDALNALNSKLIECNEARNRAVSTGTPPQSLEPGPSAAADAQRRGCIGQALTTCLANLHAFAYYSDDDAAKELQRSQEVDINGKRRFSNSINLLARLKDVDKPTSVTIDFDNNRIVNSVEISLPDDPALAETEAEYDRTGLYTALQAIFGDSCASLDRIATYKFFQN
jgi:hypothetical protein